LSDPGHFRGGLLGLAIGDAIGTTLEFTSRGAFKPITDMLGGGPFHLKPGQWTDDTSMALCLATSLVECHGFDARDQMDRYHRWYEDGYLSSTGRCFDIGVTTRASLDRYRATGDPFAGPTLPNTAGNGCIMRLAPVPMFFCSDPEAARHYAAESSRTTHGAPECLEACRLFAGMLVGAINGDSKEEVLLRDARSFKGSANLMAIARGEYRTKSEDAIHGTGYVVQSLEAALWCFDKTKSFEAAVLRAANLGGDADTTAAVCGQVAGAFYGEAGIPEKWRKRVAMQDDSSGSRTRSTKPRVNPRSLGWHHSLVGHRDGCRITFAEPRSLRAPNLFRQAHWKGINFGSRASASRGHTWSFVRIYCMRCSSILVLLFTNLAVK
jgi:ADP-ribosyl-[dinitrogen reductase] hydrolase